MNRLKYLVFIGNGSNQIQNQLQILDDWFMIKKLEILKIQILFGSQQIFHLRYIHQIINKIQQYNLYFQILNHFEFNSYLNTKNGLINSLKQYYQSNQLAKSHEYGVWDTTPNSYIINADFDASEFKLFEKAYRLIQKNYIYKNMVPQKHCQENIWIVKPINLNQGRGIQLFTNLSEIKLFLSQKPIQSLFVAQKYIEQPMLYKKRKFDIRIWVLVTDKFEIYMYKDGYLRTSSDYYTTDNQKNGVHLTNNCLQKGMENYGQHEEGNTISFNDFENYLRIYNKEINFNKHIRPRIKDIVIDCILSVQEIMNQNAKYPCFELFGFDFLIDEDIRVWLIEVNSNPYLGQPNNYMKQLIPQMINDMLRIVLTSFFKDIKLGNGPNNFELIHNNTNNYTQRRSFDKDFIYPLWKPTQPEDIIQKNKEELEENKKLVNKNNLKELYLAFKRLFENYSYSDHDPYKIYFKKIFKRINNIDPNSQENLDIILKILKIIHGSKLIEIFYDPFYFQYLDNIFKILLDDQKVIEIRKEILNLIISLTKIQFSYKLFKKNPIFLQYLTTFILNEQDFDTDQQAIQALIQIFEFISCNDNYPGYRREKDMMRSYLIKSGVILIFLEIQKNLQFQNIINQIFKNIYLYEWINLSKLIQEQNFKFQEYQFMQVFLKRFNLAIQYNKIPYIMEFVNENIENKKKEEELIQKVFAPAPKQEKVEKNEKHNYSLYNIRSYSKHNKLNLINQSDKEARNISINLSKEKQKSENRQQLIDSKFKEWEKRKIKEINQKVEKEKKKLQKQQEQELLEQEEKFLILLEKQKIFHQKQLELQQKKDNEKELEQVMNKTEQQNQKKYDISQIDYKKKKKLSNYHLQSPKNKQNSLQKKIENESMQSNISQEQRNRFKSKDSQKLPFLNQCKMIMFTNQMKKIISHHNYRNDKLYKAYQIEIPKIKNKLQQYEKNQQSQ